LEQHRQNSRKTKAQSWNIESLLDSLARYGFYILYSSNLGPTTGNLLSLLDLSESKAMAFSGVVATKAIKTLFPTGILVIFPSYAIKIFQEGN
jgi:hypothetical protein